ncbi:MAG: putative quinol monooxygenase [Pseudonocardiaceae bacterium]
MTTTKALLATLEVKPGREQDVANFLKGGLPIVQDEPATTAWFAIQFGPTTYGIFDAFPDESGRQAHVNGQIPKLLQENADLFAQAPDFTMLDVLAVKLP